jgi:hypothetical protein
MGLNSLSFFLSDESREAADRLDPLPRVLAEVDHGGSAE